MKLSLARHGTAGAALVVALARCAESHDAPTLPAMPLASSSVAPPAAAAAPPPPDLHALEDLLRKRGAHRFDAAAQARGCPDDQTLGGYVDMLVQTKDDERRLRGGCADAPRWPNALPLDPPRSDEHWVCWIDARVSDAAGESPWHYELRLRVRKRDGVVDLEHLACPGL